MVGNLVKSYAIQFTTFIYLFELLFHNKSNTTKGFPKDEMFGLSMQIKRAAVSVTSNIAEGFGRKSFQEKIRFYTISRGSLLEIMNQIIIARDLKFIPDSIAKDILYKIENNSMLINGLIRSTNKMKLYGIQNSNLKSQNS
jgi:four helix bundle protein